MGKSRVGQRIGLGLGLESEDADDLVEATLSGDETVEGEMLEVTEAAGEVAEQQDAVEELEDAAEGLEDIAEALERTVDDGGLTPQAAEFMQIGVESYCSRLGIATPVVASLESFGGTADRLTATKVSMEGLKDILATIWAKIKEMLAKLKAKLAEFWLKTFDAAPKLVKRAEAIQKKAQETKGTAGEKTIKGPLKALHIGGKAPKMADAAKLLLDNAAGTRENGEKLNKSVEQFAGILSKLADKPENVESFDADVNKIADGIVSGGKTDKRFGENVEVKLSPELPGGKQTFTSCPGTGGGAVRMSMVRSGIVAVDARKEVESSGDFATMSIGDVQSVCETIIKIGNSITDYKRDWEKRSKALDELNKAGDKLSKSSKGDELSSEQQSLLRKFVGAAGNFGKSSFDGAAECNAYALGTARAILSVAEKSLAQYK